RGFRGIRRGTQRERSPRMTTAASSKENQTNDSSAAEDSGLRIVRPSAQTETTPSPQAPQPTAPPPQPAPRARYVFVALVALAAIGSGTYVWMTRGQEATDDAQVEGHIVNVAPRVAGQVAEVLVEDNQLVHEGDALVRLDTSDLETRLA